MGLFDRLSQLVRVNVNAALDGSPDPATSVGLAIDELRREVEVGRKDLVQTVAARKLHETKAGELAVEATTWEGRASNALRAGDEALAREGLARKLQAKKRESEELALASSRAADEDRLRALLADAEVKLRELESRRASLTAELRRARTADAGTSAGSRLERSLDRAAALDAELEAHAVLDDGRRASVDAELRKLARGEHDARLDDELAELKRKLGG